VDVKTILATPICEEYVDSRAWHFDIKGQFYVKSAYHVFVQNQDSGSASSSGDQNTEQFWKSIWKLPIIPKIQKFIWHLPQNSLLLRTKIKKIGMSVHFVLVVVGTYS
jgi:hypothetical protein